jgi:hypothetical protein
MGLRDLRGAFNRLQQDAIVYSYVVRSICLEDGQFRQCGSAPNFAGDLITLCTCKHRMRTYKAQEDWVRGGFWIAGFTSSTREFDHKNWLVYLMQVGEAYSSHHDLAAALRRSGRERILKAKAAHLNPRGDIFVPKPSVGRNYYDPAHYYPPIPEHSHAGGHPPGWFKDIYYPSRESPRAQLLVGDNDQSYVWTRPMIVRSAPKVLPIGNPKSLLWELVVNLETGRDSK